MSKRLVLLCLLLFGVILLWLGLSLIEDDKDNSSQSVFDIEKSQLEQQFAQRLPPLPPPKQQQKQLQETPPVVETVEEKKERRSKQPKSKPLELSDMLNGTKPAGWMPPPPTEHLMGVEIVLAHCSEIFGWKTVAKAHQAAYIKQSKDIGWDALKWLDQRIGATHVYFKCWSESYVQSMMPDFATRLKNTHFHFIDNVAREEYAYLTYLETRYPNFAEWTLFLQADDLWLPTIACFRSKFSDELAQRGYVSVSSHSVGHYLGESGTSKGVKILEKVYRQHLPFMQNITKFDGGRIRIYANAYFLVSGDTLKNVPKALWTDILSLLRQHNGNQKGGGSMAKYSLARQMGLGMEFSYHILLGGSATSNQGRTPSMVVKEYGIDFVCGMFDCASPYCYPQVWRFKLQPPGVTIEKQ